MKKRARTDTIILHCAATKEGQDIKASTIRQWHLNNGWEDIGYHFVIDLDGTIEIGRNEQYIGAHCTNHNSTSIGICYVGGCDKQGKAKDTRTPQQKQSMYRIVTYLCMKYNLTLNSVYCHNSFTSAKACPSFSLYSFKNEYQKYLETLI